ncbi:MAG: bifunctional phosphoribosyl-AMP cyclohydrolase/phosphoribosyl-ATP diphosphatase HisIE [Helicobacteraceae bacterium]|jgi:phosphoribosyl-ATP pyrophosphohydrolase/phosphoribosyl-AMP cyclohydrolase|nr:bifunctional phosphoribosyl-AMP cyclohydrolase/phosphoribosyl-ATP diphosphatase HisIE [Helicobacteraceae bacterium]
MGRYKRRATRKLGGFVGKIVAIDWAKNPLVPVAAQDYDSKEALMIAYADKQAYDLTLKTGFAHYFSRSRNRIWKKGEQSGNTQKIVDVLCDCDQDSLLYIVEQKGAACHTGHKSCFFTKAANGEIIDERIADPAKLYGVVDRLYHTILERKKADPNLSYVASLFIGGENAILKKVTEEAGELILSVKDRDKEQIVREAADLLFHTLIALASKEIAPDLIRAELTRREGISGVVEKSLRKR